MNDLISVIVPVFNDEKYLKECIESIIKQTYENLQIILIDDGSRDKSGKICDMYAEKDKRIEVIHKENGGVSSARNVGLDNARGEWVTFIDADDWVEEDFLKLMLEKATKEKADVVLCEYNRRIEKNIERVELTAKEEIINSEKHLQNALNPQTGCGYCTMKLIKKSIIKDKFDENLKAAEDALFSIRLSNKINKEVILRKALYNYRMNSESAVKRYDEEYPKKYLKAIKKIKEYLEEQHSNKEAIQNYYNFVAYHVMLIAVNYCYHPENKQKHKLSILKKVCKQTDFKEGIEKSNYEGLSLTRKITLFTIKHKMYFITEQICIFRQKQNSKKKEKK